MIDFYYWTTPNGHKVAIFLEEAKIPHRLHPVNISKNEQFDPEYLKINPNNKIPAIVDTEPSDLGHPLPVFESGAILWYLAEKVKKFIPHSHREKAEVSEWLFWQVGGLGPMAGQNSHFTLFAKEKIPYAIDRYVKETNRLYNVLNRHMENREWVAANQYTIADMAIYPWVEPHEKHGQNLEDFPHLKRWFDKMASRPAIMRVYEKAHEINPELPRPLPLRSPENLSSHPH